jgi:predicted GIY-YIG superfamily endonuclease
MSEILTSASGTRYLTSADHAPYEIVSLKDLFEPELAGLLFIREMKDRTRLEVFGEYLPFHKIFLFAKNLHLQLGLSVSTGEAPAAYILTSRKLGVFYIGSSGGICTRLYGHRKLIRSSEHHVRELSKIFLDHGESDMLAIVIHCSDREMAFSIEQKLVDFFSGDPRMLNQGTQDVRVPQLGLKQSPELLARLSELRKRYWADPERRAKMSETQRKNFLVNPERRAERSRQMLQLFSDPSERSKQSERTRRSFECQERRDRQAASTRAAFSDPETRQKYVDAARKRSGSKQLNIDGVKYAGYNEAARKLNLEAALIRYRILSNKPEWRTWRFDESA